MHRRSILDHLREVGAYHEGILRGAAKEWSKERANGQLADDEWWNVVPDTVRGWIIDGYYLALIGYLEEYARIWREKYQRLTERGKSPKKYRLLLTQAYTADRYRERIIAWREACRRSPANFRGFDLTALDSPQ